MSSRVFVNIILLILVLGLIILSIKPTLLEQTPPQTQHNTLTSLSSKDVTNIVMSNLSGTTHIVLQDDLWRMTEPVAIKANQYNVNELLTITQLNSRAHYPINQSKLDEYGLTTPEATLFLNDIEFRFGATDPLQQSRYIAIDDTIYLIDDQFSYLLSHAPGSFIDSSLLLGKTDISQIQLPTFNILKKEGNWQLSPASSSDNNKELSQDDLVRYIDEWRYAQALKITLSTSAKMNKGIAPVHIQFADQTELQFMIESNANGSVLTNIETGIQYFLTQEKYKQLLSLPTAEPATKPDA